MTFAMSKYLRGIHAKQLLIIAGCTVVGFTASKCRTDSPFAEEKIMKKTNVSESVQTTRPVKIPVSTDQTKAVHDTLPSMSDQMNMADTEGSPILLDPKTITLQDVMKLEGSRSTSIG